MPPAATDWSLFCNGAQVICEVWHRTWTCRFYQRRKIRDCRLRTVPSSRAEGSYLGHDLPALSIIILHTLHARVNPQLKYTVTFKKSCCHKLRREGVNHGKRVEEGPKYVFQDPADHKAFQELICGCDLECSWDTMSIASGREKGECHPTLRLWRDEHTEVPMILSYANNRRKSPKAYIQKTK